MHPAAFSLASVLAAPGPAQQEAIPEGTAVVVPDSVHRGYGIGGMLYLFGAGFRVLGMLSLHQSDFDPGRKGGGLVLGGVVQIAGAAMMADASLTLGRVRARQGRRLVPRAALGWTMFGVGAAIVVASRIAPVACFENPCVIATSEGAFQVGFAAATGGLSLALLSRGFSRTQLGITPGAGRRPIGLTLSGRF